MARIGARRIATRPLLDRVGQRQTGIAAVQKIELRRRALHGIVKARDLVPAADDAPRHAAEAARRGAGILSARVVVADRGYGHPNSALFAALPNSEPPPVTGAMARLPAIEPMPPSIPLWLAMFCWFCWL